MMMMIRTHKNWEKYCVGEGIGGQQQGWNQQHARSSGSEYLLTKKTRSMQNNQNLEKKTQEMHPSKREEKEHKERYFFRSYIFGMQDIEDHIDV